MRDLHVELGPAVIAELATTLPLLLEASRWWCGPRNRDRPRGDRGGARGRPGGKGRSLPVLGRVFDGS